MPRLLRLWLPLFLAACAGTPRFERPRSLSAHSWPTEIHGEADVYVIAGALSRVRTGPSGVVRFGAAAGANSAGPATPSISVNGQTLAADARGWSLDGMRVADREDSFVILARAGQPTRVVEVPPSPAPTPVPPFEPLRVGHGRLALVEGLPRVSLDGTPEEAGAALGELCGAQIRFLVEHYLPAMVADGRADALDAAHAMERHIPDEYRSEMRACAAAAGVAYDDLLLGNVLAELYQLNLCSVVAVRGTLTRDGHLLVGRNLDFPAQGMLDRCAMVVERTSSTGQRRYASVTWPGFLGVLSGMNEDGLVAANLLAEYQERSLHGMPYGFLLRRVLERARNVEEALEIVRGAERTVGNSLLFADAQDRAAVAEVTRHRMLVRRPAADRLFATNLFRSEPNYPYDCARYRLLEQAVRTAARPWDERSLPTLLDRVDIGWMNIQSMVFAPGRRELWLATGLLPAAKAPFVRVPLFLG